jgi:hypothetical protein
MGQRLYSIVARYSVKVFRSLSEIPVSGNEYMPKLTQFAENISIVDGPPVRVFGAPPNPHDHRQTCRRFIMVNSPVSVPIQVLDRIKASGPVRYLVAPTKLHIWRLEEWHALFPEAELWMPRHDPNASKRLPFACILGGILSPGWLGDLDQLIFKGNLFIQEVFFFHKRSRTLIAADFIQNHPIEPGKPQLNALWRLGGVAYPNGGVPLDIRLSFTDRTLARRSFEKLLLWDFDKLIIAHGVCIGKDAKPFVERAFRWLRR